MSKISAPGQWYKDSEKSNIRPSGMDVCVYKSTATSTMPACALQMALFIRNEKKTQVFTISLLAPSAEVENALIQEISAISPYFRHEKRRGDSFIISSDKAGEAFNSCVESMIRCIDGHVLIPENIKAQMAEDFGLNINKMRSRTLTLLERAAQYTVENHMLYTKGDLEELPTDVYETLYGRSPSFDIRIKEIIEDRKQEAERLRAQEKGKSESRAI